MKNHNGILIYLHLAKTAGTTFLSILEKNYPRNERIPIYTDPNINHLEYLQSQSIENIKCIYGHTFFGLHEAISLPYSYITLLRDPIDRVISEYYFNFYKPKITNGDALVFNSLEEFIEHKDFCNHQSKFLFGTDEFTNNAFDYIQQNINQYFSFVGITELFDESVFLMKKQFGWKEINYRKENITLNRPQKEDIPSSLLEKIAEKNQVDIAIYHYAKKIFLDNLQELDEDSKVELQNFKSIINQLNS